MNIQLVDSLIQIINSLTEEEKNILQERIVSQSKSLEIESDKFNNEPFIGMWKDREDMNDSSQWVRQLRQQDWIRIKKGNLID